MSISQSETYRSSVCYYAIYVDDSLVARIGTLEKVVLSLDPAQRRLKATRDPLGAGLCSLGDDIIEQQVNLENSDKKYFRLETIHPVLKT